MLSEKEPSKDKPVVLVVDDSEDDLALVKMAAKNLPMPIQLKTLHSGEKALEYMFGKGEFSDRTTHPVPSLIILDLKMPRVSGFDVLAKLSESKIGKPPFVCVMSASELEEDITKATALGADAFHTKPAAFNDLCTMLERLTTYFCMNPTPSTQS